ncbi:MAG: hypothetical protein RL609_1798 [Bacteroidota bacterium]|jgi:hypothetical protein
MKIKKSLITQIIDHYVLDESRNNKYLPKSGDVAMFEILEIGKHKTMQSDSKRNVSIFVGDKILAVFGDRYATEQFEGYVPTEIQSEYHILGAGGVIGILHSKNEAYKDIEPTKVRLIGYAVDESNNIINTKFFKINAPQFNPSNKGPKVILSLGATMDSGKTTTAAYISRGLYLGNKKVGFIKLTGTAYTKDKDFIFDAGAMIAMDFSDAGYPSTFTVPVTEILQIYEYLKTKICEENDLDCIVMEIADGILQQETYQLISNKAFMSTISEVVFSCGDSLSAIQGMTLFSNLEINPLFLCGKFTMSELLIKEVQKHLEIPIFTLSQLESKMANSLLNA